jgi:hypothetical protein
LRVRHARRKVFVIRWNAGGVFKIVKFEPGEWLQTLRVLANYSGEP